MAGGRAPVGFTLIALFCSAAFGCVYEARGTLPEDIAYVAAVDAVSASPLFRVPTGGGVPFTVGDGAQLYGWTEDQLALYEPPNDEALRTRPLMHPATICDPVLPQPAFSKVFRNESKTLEDLAPVHTLTAEWIGCPSRTADDYLADVISAPIYRRTDVLLDGCRATMRFEDCGVALAGRIQPDGDACFFAPECELKETFDHAHFATVSCAHPSQPCVAELHDKNKLRPAPYVPCADASCRTNVFAVPPEAVPDPPNRLTPDVLTSGYLLDLALFADRAVVLYRDQRYDDYCDVSVASHFAILDRETMQKIGDQPAPLCSQLIAPAGEYLLSASWTFPPVFSLHDRLGTTVTSTALYWAPNDQYALIKGIAFIETASIALVALAEAEEFNEARIIALRVPDLSFVAEAVLPGSPVAMVPAGENRVLLTDDGKDTSFWVDVIGDRLSVSAIVIELLGPASVGALAYAPTYRAALISGVTGSPSLHLNGIENTFLSAVSYAIDGSPTSAIELPTSPPSIAALLYAREGGVASSYLSFAHVTDSLRFEPRAARVGGGIATRLQLDEQQRLWFLSPWTGEVTRLTAPAAR